MASSSLSETLRPYSPGTMHLSDLDTSPSLNANPPRRLRPIYPPQRKKKKRKSKTLLSSPASSLSETPPSLPLMNQSMLDQLRAKMEDDPVMLPGPSSPTETPPPITTPLSTAPPDDELTPDASHSTENRARRKKRKKDKSDELNKQLSRNSPSLQKGEEDGDGEGGDESGSERGEGRRDDDEDPLSQRGRYSLEERDIDSDGVESGRRGRQLPNFPDGPIDTPLQSVATHPPETTPLNPDGPLQLLARDDIIEEVGDKGDLLHPHYTLPSLQPNPSTSHSKDLVFLERKDGKGFLMKKKSDTESIGGELGTVSPNLEDISSVDIALYIQRLLQKSALTAHGLITGISLWEAIVVNVLSRQTIGHVSLLEHYHAFTLPSHALHFLLLSLVLVSLLDRFDFAQVSKLCLQILIRTPSQIILFGAWFLVLLALVVTLSLASIDNRMILLHQQPSLWSDILTTINTTYQVPSQFSLVIPSPVNRTIVYIPSMDHTTSNRITPFLALMITRAICCVFSWMGVVWVTGYNRLEGYLLKIGDSSQSQQ